MAIDFDGANTRFLTALAVKVRVNGTAARTFYIDDGYVAPS